MNMNEGQIAVIKYIRKNPMASEKDILDNCNVTYELLHDMVHSLRLVAWYGTGYGVTFKGADEFALMDNAQRIAALEAENAALVKERDELRAERDTLKYENNNLDIRVKELDIRLNNALDREEEEHHRYLKAIVGGKEFKDERDLLYAFYRFMFEIDATSNAIEALLDEKEYEAWAELSELVTKLRTLYPQK